MALTGLQIQKILPGTNCRECGSNTCMAFAMKLAAKKAEISACPYASNDAKQILGEAYEPPVKCITLGTDELIRLGEETVLYRHEKTFVNGTLFAINIDDTYPAARITEILKAISIYGYTRVGETFSVDMVCVSKKGDDTAQFLACVERALKETGKPLIVRAGDSESLVGAAEILKGNKSVISAATVALAHEILPAVKAAGHVLAVTGANLDELTGATTKFREQGFTDIILDYGALTLAEHFQVNSLSRRSAIKESFKALGFPSIRFIDDDSDNILVQSITGVLKYGGIVVLPAFDPALLASLITMRLNIFTDPQKPIQVEPGIYPIGEPDPASAVFVTTNFSLTYFVVSSEIENSGISAWLLVPECEGMSVLTAWAAGKFNAGSIAKFVKEFNVEDKIERRELVIPGYVSTISGELEENLPGWKVLIGPQEAADIEGFVKARLT